ncbi:hypothetical protein [Leifsonia sp. A12D58]|uniref:hypothetical protein n=1 Tax=Leifsonia sp. A12D58 TaxID=3397674 RepID=UPI0039E1A967
MTTRKKTTTIAVAALIAFAGVGGLAGCAQASNMVNGAVQSASGGDVSLGGSLPNGWPTEVPVIDGELMFGAGGIADGTGWVVTVKSSAAEPLADAQALLEDAGFTVGSTAQGSQAGVVSMKNENYTVVVAGTGDGLLYTVTPISK